MFVRFLPISRRVIGERIIIQQAYDAVILIVVSLFFFLSVWLSFLSFNRRWRCFYFFTRFCSFVLVFDRSISGDGRDERHATTYDALTLILFFCFYDSFNLFSFVFGGSIANDIPGTHCMYSNSFLFFDFRRLSGDRRDEKRAKTVPI